MSVGDTAAGVQRFLFGDDLGQPARERRQAVER
ncbi:MAG: hypothetical protein JWR86_2341, partial [Enterovirga sp.]|nr:hypothetical protein [Enterovirga sp.]